MNRRLVIQGLTFLTVLGLKRSTNRCQPAVMSYTFNVYCDTPQCYTQTFSQHCSRCPQPVLYASASDAVKASRAAGSPIYHYLSCCSNLRFSSFAVKACVQACCASVLQYSTTVSHSTTTTDRRLVTEQGGQITFAEPRSSQ